MPRKHTHPKHMPFSRASSCQEKHRFLNQNEAEKAAELLSLEHPGLELGVYRCPYCLGWHLTSKRSID